MGRVFRQSLKSLFVDDIISLRRMQVKKAQEGDVPILIWLDKQCLGQSEKHELSGPADGPINQEHTLNDSAQGQVH